MFVFGYGSNNTDTEVLLTNDTHVDIYDVTRETVESANLQYGGGALLLDDPGVAAPFMQMGGFASTYAYMGRADNGMLFAQGETFVSAGTYSYLAAGEACFQSRLGDRTDVIGDIQGSENPGMAPEST